MPPKRAAAKKADAAPAATTNGTVPRRGRAAKTEAAAVNGAPTEPPKKAASKKARLFESIVTNTPSAGRGRPKKDVTKSATQTPAESPEPEPEPKPAQKRKKDDESEAEAEDAEPQPKKAKVKASKPAPEPKNQAKGPRRANGKKTEINPIRYAEPLKVFVFGEGANGELGFGATRKAIDVKRPRYNEMLTNQNVVKIATGGMHVLALTKDNKILSWGVNDNGALGRDTSNAEVKLKDMDADDSDSDSDDETGGLNDLEATPTAISEEYFPENTTFVDIAAGDSCSFVLTSEGAVYGWGTFRKNEGVLGFERSSHTANRPVYIESLKKVTHIACGTNHVLALDKDHRVYAWGSGQQNQLALLPNRVGFHDSSVKKASQKMVKIACGDYHGLAIAQDGHVWAWGANNYCETGQVTNAGEDDASVLTPKIIKSLEGLNIEHVEGGGHHNIAITAKGEALVWGRCDGSQTGIPASQLNAIDDDTKLLKNHGRPKILLEPTPIPGLSNIATAACGPEHTIVINKDGKAYSWGFSANYQTGQGTDDDIELPTLIDNTAVRDTKLTWAGAGGQYSVLASKKD
ncbi:RCC1/BLIP-II [Corynespora cassiicola Philippines]|uniref:RCC1/BLIP-II n=1 Tax=Corynespora cassiicola Philippines TaxID=1448308 RepID=A0A2T2NP40_CORCC|nr:RCC1/BLIP-II [Corynespora cassiicola Philippines]